MTIEEFKATMGELIGMATADTQAVITEKLTSMYDGFVALSTENETNKTTVKDLTDKNEVLRDVNSKLFLKVGEVPKGSETTVETVETSESSNIPNISVESLFNANGELM